MRFLMRCRKSARAERIMPNLALALLSQSRMDEIALQMNNDPIRYDERRDGILQIFHRAAGLKEASSTIDAMNEAGLVQKILSARECVDLEPALEPALARGSIEAAFSAPATAAEMPRNIQVSSLNGRNNSALPL